MTFLYVKPIIINEPKLCKHICPILRLHQCRHMKPASRSTEPQPDMSPPNCQNAPTSPRPRTDCRPPSQALAHQVKMVLAWILGHCLQFWSGTWMLGWCNWCHGWHWCHVGCNALWRPSWCRTRRVEAEQIHEIVKIYNWDRLSRKRKHAYQVRSVDNWDRDYPRRKHSFSCPSGVVGPMWDPCMPRTSTKLQPEIIWMHVLGKFKEVVLSWVLWVILALSLGTIYIHMLYHLLLSLFSQQLLDLLSFRLGTSFLHPMTIGCLEPTTPSFA